MTSKMMLENLRRRAEMHEADVLEGLGRLVDGMLHGV